MTTRPASRGDDPQDRLAGPHHLARRANTVIPEHLAGDRRLHLHPSQAFPHRGQALLRLVLLRADIADPFGGLLGPPRVDLEDPNFELRDSAPGAGDRGRRWFPTGLPGSSPRVGARARARAASAPSRRARSAPRARGAISVPCSFSDAACASSPAISFRAWPIRSRSPAASSARGRRARAEQALLAGEDVPHRRVLRRLRDRLPVPGDGIGAAHLGLQPVPPGRELGALAGKHRLFGAELGVVEAEQHLAPRHTVAVAHMDRADRPPPSICSTTWLRFSTATLPGAITAPEIEENTLQPRTPRTRIAVRGEAERQSAARRKSPRRPPASS